jgi:FlaA1/EpsC-like NDP-sugar epimerase
MDLKLGITRTVNHRSRSVGLWLLLDYAMAFAAYCAVFLSRVFLTPRDLSYSLPWIALAALSLVVSLYVFGVYRRLWSHTSGHDVTVIVYAVAAVIPIQLFVTLAISPRPLPISVVLVGNIVVLAGLVAARYRSRLVSGLSWRWNAVWNQEFPGTQTRILIVGAGESGQDLAQRLKHRFPDNNYRIVGFIDDDPHKHQMIIEGCRVLGGRRDIAHVADEENVDLIVLAIHNISGPDFREIVSLCETTQARIKVIPDLFDLVRNPHSTTLLRDIQPEDLLGRSVVTRHKDVDLSPVMRKVILITGAAGSIGSELSRQIMDYEPRKVILVDNNESGLHDMYVELHTQHPHIEMIPALVDVASMEPVRSLFKQHRPHIVFHAAAYKHVPMLEYYPQEALRVNINGTMNLAEMAVTYDVERFVLVSTDKAVNPSNIMGASKRVGELLLHALSMEPDCNTLFSAVRFGNVLGSRGSVIPTFNRQINGGGPVTVTHPEMTRYFMSIPEAVNLIIHAASLTVGDEIFVLKMGEVVRIVDLAERMIRLRGLRPYKDIAIEFTGVRPGEKLHEALYYDAENPMDTLHPNIVKLHSWPPHFVPEQFYDRVVKVIMQSPGASTAEVFAQLMDIIDPSDARASDSVPQSVQNQETFSGH